MTQPQAGTVAGRQMVQQLLMAHAPLRSDVAALRKGLEVLDAATTRTEDIEELLGGLTVADLTWQLKVGCQHFCAHLDAHHTIEDARDAAGHAAPVPRAQRSDRAAPARA